MYYNVQSHHDVGRPPPRVSMVTMVMTVTMVVCPAGVALVSRWCHAGVALVARWCPRARGPATTATTHGARRGAPARRHSDAVETDVEKDDDAAHSLAHSLLVRVCV